VYESSLLAKTEPGKGGGTGSMPYRASRTTNIKEQRHSSQLGAILRNDLSVRPQVYPALRAAGLKARLPPVGWAMLTSNL